MKTGTGPFRMNDRVAMFPGSSICGGGDISLFFLPGGGGGGGGGGGFGGRGGGGRGGREGGVVVGVVWVFSFVFPQCCVERRYPANTWGARNIAKLDRPQLKGRAVHQPAQFSIGPRTLGPAGGLHAPQGWWS